MPQLPQESNTVITVALTVITLFLGYIVFKIRTIDELRIAVAVLQSRFDSLENNISHLPKRKTDVSG